MRRNSLEFDPCFACASHNSALTQWPTLTIADHNCALSGALGLKSLTVFEAAALRQSGAFLTPCDIMDIKFSHS